ncbi:hypothetical protein [Bacteroides graminisolvens]|uniref:hypothetical protein n=1 Tax=Bacteroides graminisolvens TaxID=477666 RepID=UPI00041A4002|nr:hypothetical protein [Bacteroides graminisolvens]
MNTNKSKVRKAKEYAHPMRQPDENKGHKPNTNPRGHKEKPGYHAKRYPQRNNKTIPK